MAIRYSRPFLLSDRAQTCCARDRSEYRTHSPQANAQAQATHRRHLSSSVPTRGSFDSWAVNARTHGISRLLAFELLPFSSCTLSLGSSLPYLTLGREQSNTQHRSTTRQFQEQTGRLRIPGMLAFRGSKSPSPPVPLCTSVPRRTLQSAALRSLCCVWRRWCAW